MFGLGAERDAAHGVRQLVPSWRAQVELGGREVGVTHRLLGDLEPGVAGDVVAVSMSECVGRDLGGDARPVADPLDETPDGLLGGGGEGVVAAHAVAAGVAEALCGQDVFVVGDVAGEAWQTGSRSAITGIQRSFWPLPMSSLTQAQPGRRKWRPCAPRSSCRRRPAHAAR